MSIFRESFLEEPYVFESMMESINVELLRETFDIKTVLNKAKELWGKFVRWIKEKIKKIKYLIKSKRKESIKSSSNNSDSKAVFKYLKDEDFNNIKKLDKLIHDQLNKGSFIRRLYKEFDNIDTWGDPEQEGKAYKIFEDEGNIVDIISKIKVDNIELIEKENSLSNNNRIMNEYFDIADHIEGHFDKLLDEVKNNEQMLKAFEQKCDGDENAEFGRWIITVLNRDVNMYKILYNKCLDSVNTLDSCLSHNIKVYNSIEKPENKNEK